jgi:hypothetical protein
MMLFNKEINFGKFIIWAYFSVAAVEVIGEVFSYKPILFVFKPLTLAVLMILYWLTSAKRNLLFIAVILFALITNVFFIFETETMLFLGLIVFIIHRLLMIYYMTKLIQLKDYIPFFIAMIPFLFIFFYLLSISSGITNRSYGILIRAC